MEKITVKRKEFEIVEKVNETDYIVLFKKGQYLLKRFGENETGYKNLLFNLKRLFNSGVPCYKVFRCDNKTHDVVLTYQAGETIYQILLKKPLDESVFEELFRVNFIARQNACFLNYSPKMWIFSKDKLFYLGTEFENLTEKNKNYFVDIGIKYWYHTREFKEFVIKNGDPLDKNLFKTEFEANKELLLIVCKHYR